jgi:uncharacterized SAM-binding protein YcdF (DUF218 family)
MTSAIALLAILDPALCPTKSTATWVSFTQFLFHWLITPSLMLPILLALVSLPWLLPYRHRKTISLMGMALLIAYLLAPTPWAIALGNRGLTSLIPEDPGTAAEAIVVLGRGAAFRPDRVQVATELWQKQRSPLIFVSGSGDAIEIVEMLRQKGIPEQGLEGEPCSRTTEENAQYTAAILQPQGMRRIVLVTDPPHMLRSLLTFRSFGFDVLPHSNPLPSTISRQNRGLLVVREYVGLLAYGLRGRFFPRTPPSIGDFLAAFASQFPGGVIAISNSPAPSPRL